MQVIARCMSNTHLRLRGAPATLCICVVKGEFMKPPYSTWTAVCVDALFGERDVVEIQVTAYAPLLKTKASAPAADKSP